MPLQPRKPIPQFLPSDGTKHESTTSNGCPQDDSATHASNGTSNVDSIYLTVGFAIPHGETLEISGTLELETDDEKPYHMTPRPGTSDWYEQGTENVKHTLADMMIGYGWLPSVDYNDKKFCLPFSKLIIMIGTIKIQWGFPISRAEQTFLSHVLIPFSRADEKSCGEGSEEVQTLFSAGWKSILHLKATAERCSRKSRAQDTEAGVRGSPGGSQKSRNWETSGIAKLFQDMVLTEEYKNTEKLKDAEVEDLCLVFREMESIYHRSPIPTKADQDHEVRFRTPTRSELARQAYERSRLSSSDEDENHNGEVGISAITELPESNTASHKEDQCCDARMEKQELRGEAEVQHSCDDDEEESGTEGGKPAQAENTRIQYCSDDEEVKDAGVAMGEPASAEKGELQEPQEPRSHGDEAGEETSAEQKGAQYSSDDEDEESSTILRQQPYDKKVWEYYSDDDDEEDGGVAIRNVRTLYEELAEKHEEMKEYLGGKYWRISKFAEQWMGEDGRLEMLRAQAKSSVRKSSG
ncbi:uncharacterized protein LY89DRAFT_770823 [Mollisia scopiformis]|uniref:Uncharacterized protein n=1 Tax=Mollisia scopiformis TaxID=149040 RepID=A0A194XNX9_MOLSC|nr:uncharacterized protein LY89DRAFT_770823 [Mollisia scopiformis]KUJ21437.1 hypothetical protein LY89DRAFT_770823 [Mollisia scopiformis]